MILKAAGSSPVIRPVLKRDKKVIKVIKALNEYLHIKRHVGRLLTKCYSE